MQLARTNCNRNRRRPGNRPRHCAQVRCRRRGRRRNRPHGKRSPPGRRGNSRRRRQGRSNHRRYFTRGRLRKIVRGAREAFGAIHILVNNAGIFGPVRPVEKVSAAEWDLVLAVNLRAPFLLARLVLPEMYERGSGAIVNISTIGAKVAYPMNCTYAASKAGLDGLTRTLAAESARKGVRVNAICPAR